MKKLIAFLGGIVLLLALSIPARAMIREIPVTGITGSANTAVMGPVQYLTDNDPATAWQSGGATASPLWVELQLGQAAFIEGLRIYGPYFGNLNIEYWQDGGWHRFLAVRDVTGSSSGWNLIDLSYDRIITDKIRLTLCATQSGNLGGIGEVKILGRLPESLFERLDPVAVSAGRFTKAEHPAANLFDHNTYTSWQTGYGMFNDAGVVADLGGTCAVSRIKLFGGDDNDRHHRDNGRFKLQYLSNDCWFDIPGMGNLDLSQLGNTWRSFNLENPIHTAKIRITFLGYQGTGGLKEVEFWGRKDTLSGSKYLYMSQTPVTLSESSSANYCFNITPSVGGLINLHLAGSGNPNTILTWELNGRAMGELKAVSRNNGRSFYLAAIAPESFWSGANFIRVTGSGFTIDDCRIELAKDNGPNIPLDTGLVDRWRLTPVSGGRIIDLGGLYHIDEFRFTYPGNRPNLQLAVDLNGQWVNIDTPAQHESAATGGTLTFTGIGLVRRIKVDINTPDSPAELIIHGSRVNDGPPQVRITAPLDGDCLDLQEWAQQKLTGTVDNPATKLTVNGKHFGLAGTNFSIPLPELGLKPNETKELVVVATDGSGRSGTDKITISIGLPPGFSLNLPDQIIYTKDARITVSGQVLVPGSKVWVNGAAVPVTNRNFSTVVELREGLNEIMVKVASFANLKIANIKQRWVVRNSAAPYLKVLYPADGQVTKDSTIQVSGEVSSLSPVQVTVNGQTAVVVASGYFALTAVPLTEGDNPLVVTATDSSGASTKAALTVKRDGAPPVLTNIVPADGAMLNTTTITVSGQVTDASPVTVLVNGRVAPVSNGRFSVSLAMNEGQNSLKITAYDAAGNQSGLTSGVYIDTTPPAEFTPAVTPSGWTNNNKPVISFYTTDAGSGIAHFELKLDDGAWSLPVTSPYQFATAIADGEHTVRVKAVDKAGNERIGEVKVYIDTTPPNVPQIFRVIPGNGRMVLKWSDDSTDVVEYQLERDPAFTTATSPMVSVNKKEYIDPDLENGTTFKYRVRAIDRAGNQSEITEWKEGTVGVAVAPYVPEQGAVVEYDGIVLAFPKTGVPEAVAKIEVTEVKSEYLEQKMINPQIGPIYEFSAVKNDGTYMESITTSEGYLGKIQYDPAEIPQGFPEHNLGVYYYDPMFDRWFQIPSAGIDIQNHTIYFITNHFSSFSVQATIVQDLTAQEYKDAGYSPLRSYSEYNEILVSPQGGTASTSVTELVLPGRNGFDFVLKRRYDSATSRADAFALAINGQMGFNLFNPASNTIQSASDAANTFSIWKEAGYQLADNIRNLIEQYLFNQGDYAYSMGQGWRLNLPYIKAANGSLMVVTADGTISSVSEMDLTTYVSADVSGVGGTRILALRQHEGDDFILTTFQVNANFDITGIFGCRQETILKSRWYSLNYTLKMRDGTTYELDALGRTTKITDPTGMNVITINYNGLQLWSIQDSMGRIIRFEYTESNDFLWTRISRIWVENDSYHREIKYNVGSNGLLNSAIDTGGRVSTYTYDYRVLYNGEVGFTINILEIIVKAICPFFNFVGPIFGTNDVVLFGNVQAQVVYPLKEVTSPGQGTVHIGYDQPTITYGSTRVDYWWIVPASITFSLNLKQRLLANQVTVYQYPGGPVSRSTNFNYDISFYSYGQPFIKQTTESDDRRRTVYHYTPLEKARHRWDDSNGRLVVDQNGLVEVRPKEKIPDNCLVIHFPVIFTNIDILPVNTATYVYDAQTGDLLETYTNQYDINTMYPIEQTTWRGGNYRKITYKYDDWGNVVYKEDYSATADRVNQVKIWMYYLPDNSCPEPGAPWINVPFTQVKLEKDRHNLLAGKVVANIVPSQSGQSHVIYLHTYNQYNNLGQLIKTFQWNGGEWLTTEFEYNSSNGYLVKKINPEGHETVYEYDSHGLPAAVTEKGVQDAKGATCDITTRYGYEYITGWKLWQQDPRGYVTEYQYDALGRTTKIIAPDDDDQAGWIPAGSVPAFRANNPVTAISYDDIDLYSVVTDPLGRRTKYDFDSLGRLEQLVKYHREDGADKPVITTLEYNGWGEIIAITDPNGNTTRYQYDALGRNTAIEYPDEQGRKPTKRMEFDYTGNILTITDENGKQAFEYQDMQGRTYKKVQYNNYQPVITEHYFDGLGNEVITVDPKGGVTTRTYNQLNQLARIDLPTEKFWENGAEITVAPYQRFTYDKAGFKIEEIRPLAGTGTEITNRFEVDALGRTIRTVTPYRVDNVWTDAISEIYYDGNGNKVKVIDANNTLLPREQQKAATYEYSAANLLIAEIDPAGHKTTYTYDKAGNRTSMTDPRGNSGKYDGDFTIVYQYDDLNRLVRGLLPMAPGQTAKPEVSLKYDARGNLIERIEPDGGRTIYTYTARNKVATETVSGDGVSYTTVHRYDLAGNEIETIDPKGNKIVKEYDDLNQVKTIIYPEPNGKVVERFKYDENGNRVQYINGRAVITHYRYDRYNRLVEVQDGNQGVTSYHYDRWGNMTQMVNALGHVTSYEYDELNRLLKETDPQGYVKQYGYDAVGNRLWSIDPNGTRSDYRYTPNHLVSQVTVRNGDNEKKINYLYDEAGFRKWVKYGEVITEYNMDGNRYVPDPFGRIHKETKTFDGKSFTVGYDYDVMGRVAKVTYPTGQAVEYRYNSLGQLQKVPGFVDDTPVYDQGGLLESITAANGITASYDYDQNGRLIGLSYANQAAALKAYTLQYDEANNIVKRNNDTFQYDFLNQLLYANLKGNFEISPDEETQKIGKTRSDFKGQKTFEFELNQLDVIELDYAAGSIGVDLLAPVKVTKITLQPNSPIHRVAKPTSIRVYISQDNISYTRLKEWKMVAKEKGRLEIVLDTPVTARFIKVKSMFDERDNRLNPVNRAQFKNVPQDLIHVYYLMNMRQEEYTYDKIGNRLTETVTQRYPVSRTYVYYPNSSRLQSNGKYSFEYDANGNLIKKETLIGEKVIWKYEYDLFNRLVKVLKNDQTVAEYMYDEAGLRIKKTSPKGQVYYVFDTGGNVLYEQENREYMEYIYVLGKHFARVDGNLDNGITKKYFYHTDHLGSTVLVTDEAGQQVWSAEYTPFGKQVSKESEFDRAAKFTGKDLDEDTGLYYFNARWYDQEVGRFISEDSYRGDPNDPRTLNYYTYGANNPLLFIDPTGHTFEQFLGNLLGIIMDRNRFLGLFDKKDVVKENIAKRDEMAKGANGDPTVATAQASLAILGYDLGKYGVDGKQGDYTTKAIADFQEAAGLNPTGKIDAQTTVALNMAVGAGLNKGQIEMIGQAMGHLNDDRLNWPTQSRRITSNFGPRIHPITGEQNSFHGGVDILAIVPGISGDKVVAAAEGKVVKSAYQYNEKTRRGAGYYLVIESIVNNTRLQTFYMHLQKDSMVVNQGDLVRSGQHIANMGSTGGSTGPHLHFEIRVYKNGDWVPVDPMAWKYNY